MPQVSHIHILFEGEDQEVTIRAAQFVVISEEIARSVPFFVLSTLLV